MTTRDAAQLIAELWEQFRPLVDARIRVIEEYVTDREAAQVGDGRTRVSEALRERARQAAHNLSGALGSYGRPAGSTLAARIDGELAADTVDLDALRQTLVELREAVSR